jgi:acylphosphatase
MEKLFISLLFTHILVPTQITSMHCNRIFMAVTAKHLIIHGRVQGVGYRAWTVSRAKQLGLNGWVRNRTDGTVEAVIAGEPSAIEHMLTACHEGPIAARVTKLEVADWEGDVAAGFTSQATA